MTKPSGKLDTRAILRPGTQLICAMADFDAADGYQLRLDEVGDGIRFSHGFCDEEEEEIDLEEELGESLAVSSAGLEGGEEIMFLSQGGYTSTGENEGDQQPYTKCTPPFLVSRRFIKAIKAKEKARVTIYGESGELESDGGETMTIKVNGEAREVQALVARDEEQGIVIKFLDDDVWPLLLLAEFQGDNYIRLVGIHTPEA